MKRNFLLCGSLGWCLEVFWTGLHSLLNGQPTMMGQTSLLMFPIYGCGAFLSPALKLIDFWIGDQKVSLPEQLIRHGMIDMVLIFTAEYISGAWLRARGMCPWDYSDCPLQYQGVIRFDFAPLWFLTGLLFERVILYRSSNQDSEFSQN